MAGWASSDGSPYPEANLVWSEGVNRIGRDVVRRTVENRYAGLKNDIAN